MQNIPSDATGFKRRSDYIVDTAAGQSYREGVHRYEIWTLVSYTLNFVTREQAIFQLHLHLKFYNTSQPLHEQAVSDRLKPSHFIMKVGQIGPHLNKSLRFEYPTFV